MKKKSVWKPCLKKPLKRGSHPRRSLFINFVRNMSNFLFLITRSQHSVRLFFQKKQKSIRDSKPCLGYHCCMGFIFHLIRSSYTPELTFSDKLSDSSIELTYKSGVWLTTLAAVSTVYDCVQMRSIDPIEKIPLYLFKGIAITQVATVGIASVVQTLSGVKTIADGCIDFVAPIDSPLLNGLVVYLLIEMGKKGVQQVGFKVIAATAVAAGMIKVAAMGIESCLAYRNT